MEWSRQERISITFVTCWEVLRAVDQTPAVALHLFNFLVRCL